MIVNYGGVCDYNLGLEPAPHNGILLEIFTSWKEAGLVVCKTDHVIFKTYSKKGSEMFFMKVL